MGFHRLSTDIGLHDLLPKASVSPQINSSTVQTSITLKAVQTPPSPPSPPFPVGALQASAFPLVCPLTPEVQGQARASDIHRTVAGLAPRGCPHSCGNRGAAARSFLTAHCGC